MRLHKAAANIIDVQNLGNFWLAEALEKEFEPIILQSADF